MDEYKKYLADQVLGEEKINAMRPGTIHATYLIYGIRKVENVQEDGDVEMTSSPPDVEPLSEDVVTYSLSLVPGDRLKEVLASYEDVSSFHVYSLARHPIRMLADVAQQVREQSGDDSISMLETYGSITNPNVRKRDRKGKPVPTPAPVASAAKPVKKEPSPPTAKPAADKKAEEPLKKEAKPPAKESPFSMAAGKKGAAPPPLKKSGSSGIMGSFAKAAAKAASKPKEAPKKAPPVNDSPALSDDGEDDDEDIPAAKPSSDGRKSRKEREADLKRMMEEESEEEEEPEEKEEEPEDEPMEEPEPEPEAKKEPEQSEVVASSGDGRRRGKRKVMKKKQIMDDEGYLVTMEEAVWEEFSEDEAPKSTPAPAARPKPSTAPSSGSQASKTKKAAPKGQGNIMSFFSKK
ncbi:unnamed protein product [Colletotrichum noveboracense]|uniref:DNA polymerase delta subunit 3 n=1 Tax=Colletotrichum noveboracense TaxID=2664923 RepID=A0A9W4S9J9_9PEZI|nr:unnamed protein product [Colletotrichum noveboracense]